MKLIPVHYFVPTFWLCLEEWMEAPAEIWEHPKLIKFIPEQIAHKGYLKPIQPDIKQFRSQPLSSVPHLYSFPLGEDFRSERFLSESCVTWGCAKNKVDEFGERGRRSIFLALFKIYYLLGFRTIYLCGVDFNMTVEQPYSYTRKKNAIAVSENNILYKSLTRRLQALLPYFEEAGMKIYNCNPASHLTLFPFKDFEQCLIESESA